MFSCPYKKPFVPLMILKMKNKKTSEREMTLLFWITVQSLKVIPAPFGSTSTRLGKLIRVLPLLITMSPSNLPKMSQMLLRTSFRLFILPIAPPMRPSSLKQPSIPMYSSLQKSLLMNYVKLYPAFIRPKRLDRIRFLLTFSKHALSSLNMCCCSFLISLSVPIPFLGF